MVAQAQLRERNAGTLSGNASVQDPEEKFLQVGRLIERFCGRDGLINEGRVWTERVSECPQLVCVLGLRTQPLRRFGT
ncbi:hypothetical protein SAMN05444920_104778 [Nonomuraea solani]|uniref:Uncharacterized protein n=1 Tax=Nonomuraea solani TaxID=1144553 RepID=A0A1H6D3Q8_9ACTN|nr:hypothetical protein SAMN05444920_104778 [Nonomuraea solani]